MLRLALFGAGRLGRQNITRAVETGQARLTAACDASSAAAEALAGDFGAAVCPDLAALLDSGPDALFVCTPPRVRREALLDAAARGIHVFVEKPPAYAWPDAVECAGALRRAGVITACGFQGRYTRALQRARELLAGRRLQATLSHGFFDHYVNDYWPSWYLRYADAGGPLCEQAIHAFDGLRFIAGDIAEVHARGAHRFHPPTAEHDAEDTLALSLLYADGALGTHTHGCANRAGGCGLEFIAPDVRLRVGWFGGPLGGTVDGVAIDEDPPSDPARDKVASFLTAIETGDRSLVLSGYDDACRTLAVSLAGNASLRSGSPEPVPSLENPS
ncbi:MAG: Gfo/Idh/MocA family oxidoreductase [Armatimonadetes bacterium]|nr:Gfo/Idh/MocA family oxidoreductase [Armatimonadota bacterium]